MSQYVPKPDLEGINAPDPESHNRMRDLAILLGGFLAIVAISTFLFTTALDWALQRISIQSEIHYLGRFWKQIPKKKSSTDFQDFVGLISGHVHFPIRVDIMCSKEPNAFTLPGGQIYLTSGLLKTLQSENGLAFILGHEIGHIVHRDHLRGAAHSLAFAITSFILGIDQTGAADSLNQLVNKAFDRNQENAADDYGLEILRKLFGHTFHAEELFAVLAKDETQTIRALARIASTHPPSKDRTERIQATHQGEPRAAKTPQRPFSEWAKEAGCKQ